MFLFHLLNLVRWILDLPKDSCHSRRLRKLLCWGFTLRWLELSIAPPLSVVHPRHRCFLESLLSSWAIALDQWRVYFLTSWGTQINLLSTNPRRVVHVVLVFLRLVYRSAIWHNVRVWILLVTLIVALVMLGWLLSSTNAAASGAKRIS